MENSVFDSVLDKDETLIATLKPNKMRYFFINLIISLILIFLIGLGLVISGVVLYAVFGYDDLQILLPMTLTGSVFIIILIIYIVYLSLVFNHTYYGITSKRLMIRTGWIGVKYQSLDLKYVTSIDVSIGILDLIIKHHTGTIRFATSAAPFCLNSHNFKKSFFTFQCIDNPVDTYQKIKQYIYKEQNKA